jgi:hypothetical protein
MTGRPRSTAPKRDKLIKVLVTPDLLALVTAAARKEGRSVSDWGQRLFEREVRMAERIPSRPIVRSDGASRPPRTHAESIAKKIALDAQIPGRRTGGKAR